MKSPGGSGSSYLTLTGASRRSGGVSVFLTWGFEPRPIGQWEQDVFAPRDGASISFVPSELTIIPNSATGFEFSHNGNTYPEGFMCEIDDKAHYEASTGQQRVAGSIDVGVTHDTGGKPVVYGDYIHTWKQVWELLDFSFVLKNIGIDLSGATKPDSWRAESEMYV